MTAKSIYSSRAAFFEETTFATGPADAAAWAGSGQLLDHTAIDVAMIKGSWIKDPTAEVDPLATGKRQLIRGIENTEAKLSGKIHGLGVEVAEDAQAPLTALAKIFRHVWGGVSRSNTTEITGGTASQPIVNATTNLEVGQIAWFEDLSSPAAEHAGLCFPARILAIDGGTKTLTLEEALPWTPAAGDMCRASVTIYQDADVMVDSAANVANGQSFSWWFQLARSSAADLCWELLGCSGNLAFTGLTRNGTPGWDLSIMACKFNHGDLTAPSWSGSSYGFAPLAIGRTTIFGMSDFGDDTRNIIDCASLAVEPGVTRTREETITQVTHNAQGTWTYAFDVGDAGFNVTLGRESGEYASELVAGTLKRAYYAQPAPAGKCWAIWLPKAQIGETPVDTKMQRVHGAQVKLNAMIDTTNGATALINSPLLISLA